MVIDRPSAGALGATARPSPADGRLARGVRSRALITRRAVEIASIDGLDGVSFGKLADDLGISKAGIQTLFRTKEQLQLATVEAAGELFAEAVVRPAEHARTGVDRVRALVVQWVAYASAPLLPGGCFWTANLPEYDSRPGAIRDLLVRQRRWWRTLLADEIAAAVAAGEVATSDADLGAFQIVAVLDAANISLRLGDSSVIDLVNRVVDGVLHSSGDTHRG
ncbi:TetR/AcrR family transcriptional regulator [Nocardia cyriacigeorgica]|uniref:TetR/AcrR family transcriptional regulator n=1 Tax=Nocardia cyriacigeorgica TaxID=135487 RepID=A0A6P1D6H6_9NOCA|nr:TetR/AcrR family transcriptional regulator [Nocardia cyriacigeorgica]NEW45101.1 TetR/AcrR family transcriptional regulator [Nocardia cyriacigeorgica]NEW54273.1 TetR/AcrR family transcriptional regulator [Nocardia cyriacigeorgica]